MFSSSAQSTFATLVTKATSELLPTEDIALNLQVCDYIRGKKIPANQAAKILKDRLAHKNPNVQLLTLKVLEMCVKNCGHGFHVEIAARPFVDAMVSMVRFNTETNYDVKTKNLELIQGWAKAFTGQYDLAAVGDVYNMLRNEGMSFPPLRPEASEIMLEAVTAPDWSDSDVCMRCRSAFTMIRRKHHCRNCGQTFCSTCCSKKLPLPDLGIEDEERVCDGCFEQKTNPALKYGSSVSNQSLYGGSSNGSTNASGSYYQSPAPSSLNGMYGGIYGNSTSSAGYSSSAPSSSSSGYPGYGGSSGYGGSYGNSSAASSNLRGSSGARNDDDEDLKRALELSLKETRGGSSYSSTSSSSYSQPSSTSNQRPSQPKSTSEDDDADLAAAIAASLNDVTISSSGNTQAKTNSSNSSSSQSSSKPPTTAATSFSQKNQSSSVFSDELSETEKNSISLFSKLIYKIEQNGDSIIGNRELQELHSEICTLHPKLFSNLEDVDEKIDRLTEMNEKITEILELYNRIIEERMAFVSRRSDYAPMSTSNPPQSSHHYQTPPPPASHGYSTQYPPQSQSQGYQAPTATIAAVAAAAPSYQPHQGYSNPNAAPVVNGASYYPPTTTGPPAPVHNPNAVPSVSGGYGAPPPVSYGAAPPPSSSGASPAPAMYNSGYGGSYQAPQSQYPPSQTQYPAMQNQYASPFSPLIDI